MIDFFGAWIIKVINILGYPGVFILMALESAGIPFPSFVTMPFAGSLICQGRFDFLLLVIIGTSGNLGGSLVAYSLGWWGQENVIRRAIKKWGKYILMTEDRLEQYEEWFRRYGEITIFVTRLIPGVRCFISLPAGIAKMNLTKFIIYNTTGSFLWSLFMAYVGMVLGNNWKAIEAYFHKFDLVIIIIIAISIIAFIYYQINKIKFFSIKHK